ncbi:MAG: DHH family phosphoesterase, partial [Clostridiaceae bacterium]|nr:DHH family phosphoesterase [Clostridiaceae bacterium]
FQELYSFAALGIDMALSRGGDQVVVKTRNAFEFYGGRSKELEKRTRVKSRVMANALRQLIRDSSHVFIMGHRFSDLDCIGAAAGLAALTRSCGKRPYILADRKLTSTRDLIERLEKQPQYEGSFIGEQEALLLADPASLCIVCDTSRPEIVEAPSLLQAVQRVAVVDHHRRAANYIENAAINMHETYASSTSELVSELMQYTVTPQAVLKLEAEALLAGIFLDTKGFTIKTGVRTFEAAAYLKQLGADTVDVRKMFSGEMGDYVKKYRIISQASQPYEGISLAVTDDQVERAIASQAADELINISGVKAAFVVFAEGSGSCISARSYGQMNVQVVLEKIGGGGTLTGAGAQFPDKAPDEAAQLLMDAIGEYLHDLEVSENKTGGNN